MSFQDGLNGFNDALKFDAATKYGESCRLKLGRDGGTGVGIGSPGCAIALLVAWGLASALGWVCNLGPNMWKIPVVLGVLGCVVFGWCVALELSEPHYKPNPDHTRKVVHTCGTVAVLLALALMGWWFWPWSGSSSSS